MASSETIKIIIKDKITNKLIALKLKGQTNFKRVEEVLKKRYDHLKDKSIGFYLRNEELSAEVTLKELVTDKGYTEKEKIELREKAAPKKVEAKGIDFVKMMSKGGKDFDRAVLEMLVQAEVISRELAESVFDSATFEKKSFITALVEGSYVAERNVLSTLSRFLEVPSVELDRVSISPSLLNLIPENVAEYYCILPVRQEGEVLSVAVKNPFDSDKLHDLRLITGLEIEPLIATEPSIKQQIKILYKSISADIPEQTAALDNDDVFSDNKLVIKDGKKVDIGDVNDDDFNAPTLWSDKGDEFPQPVEEEDDEERESPFPPGQIWEAPTLNTSSEEILGPVDEEDEDEQPEMQPLDIPFDEKPEENMPSLDISFGEEEEEPENNALDISYEEKTQPEEKSLEVKEPELPKIPGELFEDTPEETPEKQLDDEHDEGLTSKLTSSIQEALPFDGPIDEDEYEDEEDEEDEDERQDLSDIEEPEEQELPKLDEPEEQELPKLDEPEEQELPKLDEPEEQELPKLDEPEEQELPKLDEQELPKLDTPEEQELPKLEEPEEQELPKLDEPEEQELPKLDKPEEQELPKVDTPEEQELPKVDTPEEQEFPKVDTPEEQELPKIEKPEEQDLPEEPEGKLEEPEEQDLPEKPEEQELPEIEEPEEQDLAEEKELPEKSEDEVKNEELGEEIPIFAGLNPDSISDSKDLEDDDEEDLDDEEGKASDFLKTEVDIESNLLKTSDMLKTEKIDLHAQLAAKNIITPEDMELENEIREENIEDRLDTKEFNIKDNKFKLEKAKKKEVEEDIIVDNTIESNQPVDISEDNQMIDTSKKNLIEPDDSDTDEIPKEEVVATKEELEEKNERQEEKVGEEEDSKIRAEIERKSKKEIERKEEENKELKEKMKRIENQLEEKKERQKFSREVTARYYKKMYVFHTYPVAVLFSPKELKKISESGISQAKGKAIKVKKENPVIDIIPHFPGCISTPQKISLDVSPKETYAKFWITPLSEGKIEEAKIDINYEGKHISDVQLKMSVNKQRMAKLSFVCGLLSPILTFIYEMYGGGKMLIKLPYALQQVVLYIQKLATYLGGTLNLGLAVGVFLIFLSTLIYLFKKDKQAKPLVTLIDFS